MDKTRHVLVTGATGFVASQIVTDLLADGHRVRGTVRSLGRPDSYAHLTALPGAAERLELVEADLTAPHAFDEAVQEITDVMHTASPYALNVADAQRDLVDPAVLGTTSVLRACEQTPSVRRVILTSSMAAITDEPDSGHVLTEADWNTMSSLKRNPYYFSKTEAERAAWAFMADSSRAFDLVVINPFMIIGPEYGSRVNTSNQILVDIASGAYPGVLSLSWGFVDVRDVSLAHLRAMEVPEAQGRYICAGEVVSMRELIGLMRSSVPSSARLPSRGLDNGPGSLVTRVASYFQPKGVGSYLRTHLGRVPNYDTSKIRTELGVSFRPASQTVADTVEHLVSIGQIRPD